MKLHPLFLLIFIVLLAACAPQSVATPSPVPVVTNKPLVTTTPTPEPTQIIESTPISIPMSEILLDSCRQIVEAKISSAGILEIVFEGNNNSLSNSVVSEFWFSDSGQRISSAIWSEDTQKAIPFPLPPGVFYAKISSDHRWLLFRHDATETQSEFWVIGMDGKDAKKLGSVRLDETIKAKYPDRYFSLAYGWVPNTDKFFYEVDVFYAEEYSPLIVDKFVLVDVNSGKTIPVTIPSDIQTFSFAPDGSQMAILTESGLRVLNTQDGRTLFTIQASLNEPTYSPDGKYILDFIDGGILLIDAQAGQQQIIPLKYTIISTRTEGPSFGPLPDFKWISNSTFIFSSLNLDERFFFPIFKSDPNWTFTVWQVDLAGRTTHPIQTFNGTPYQASFSPDMKYLAFLKYEGTLPSQTKELILADLATGEILETIAGGVFEIWFPDSNQYLYTTNTINPSPDPSPDPPPTLQPGKGDPGAIDIIIKHYLGQIGKEPVLANSSLFDLGRYGWWWVDKNRLVADCKIITLR